MFLGGWLNGLSRSSLVLVRLQGEINVCRDGDVEGSELVGLIGCRHNQVAVGVSVEDQLLAHHLRAAPRAVAAGDGRGGRRWRWGGGGRGGVRADLSALGSGLWALGSGLWGPGLLALGSGL